VIRHHAQTLTLRYWWGNHVAVDRRALPYSEWLTTSIASLRSFTRSLRARAENFFRRNARLGVHFVQDRWTDEVTFASSRCVFAAIAGKHRAFFFAQLDVAENPLLGLRGNDRAHL